MKNWWKHLVGMRKFWGGDPAPATSTTTSSQSYSPEETAARQKILQAGGQAYDQASSAYSKIINPNAVPVAPSAATQQGQQMVMNAATGQGQQVANAGGNALNFGLSGDVLNTANNPGLAGTINTALNRVGQAYTDPGGVLSQIKSHFNSDTDGQSSRQAMAEGMAGRNYLQTIGDTTANMQNSAYNSGLDYMKSSMAFAPNMYNLMMQPGLSVGAVGNQQEQYAQQQNNYQAGTNLWGANSGYAALQPYASLISGMSNPTTTTTGTSPTAQKNAMAPLGMAMMGSSAATMMGMDPMIGGGAALAMALMG